MPAYGTEMLSRLMALAVALLPGFDTAIAAGLTPETTQAFERHIRTVEAQVDRRLTSGQFLWPRPVPVC